jgi:AcrR family transcriptional regulator
MTKTFTKLSPEKQEAILDAAAYVFARKGYHQANVIDICKKASISNGALYKYFRNKKDLYTKVFSSHVVGFHITPV